MPSTDGTITLKTHDLHAPVTIAYDAHGVPTITAASEDDAYFALGYAHARERMFQMEMMRRAGAGRLSEVIGKLGLSTDRFVRTLGLYRRAEADFAGLDPAVQHIFQHYADGVNAWLQTRDRPLPLEFQILWLTPEPWTPVDSLVWQKLMGLQLAGNYDEELLRAALDAKLGPERAETLFSPPRAGDPVTVTVPAGAMKETRATPEDNALFGTLAPERLLREVMRVAMPTLASNAWAIAGARTASGHPILANDPHLGFQMPSLWYLAILKTPTLTLTGATVPGVPLHLLGHNGSVAWGITTTHGDTEDLFIEHVLSGGSYETPTGPEEFATRHETIAVRFGTPQEITVRETRHGPVLSDVLTPGRVPANVTAGGSVLALSAALLQPGDRSAEGMYRMARAHDVNAFREALRLFDAPEQNVMFADSQHIGYVAAGRVPIRKAGDGTAPAPGWNGDYDWTGWVPFEQLPQVIDPAESYIVNGNNRVMGPGTEPLLAVHWPEAYRARRIISLIASVKAPLTVDDVVAIQTDATSIAAAEMLPLLLPNVQPRNDAEKALLQALQGWDGTMARDRREPLVFAAWMDRLKHALVADDLGDVYDSYYGERIDVLRNMLNGAADRGVAWCDDVATPEHETCPQRIQLAWNDAIDWIKAHDARAMADWRWDDLHKATFTHQVFGTFPVLGPLSSRAIAAPGGEYTINRGAYRELDSAHPLADVHGPGFRGVYDLGDLEHSRFALAGGQSGHLASPHYSDLLAPWRDGQGLVLAPTGGSETARLTLVPAP